MTNGSAMEYFLEEMNGIIEEELQYVDGHPPDEALEEGKALIDLCVTGEETAAAASS